MDVIFGGIVTLIVTGIVQVVVIPRVQAHNRGRERWEKDVDALVSLMEDQLRRTFETAKWATYRSQHAREWIVRPELDQQKEHFSAYLQTAEAELREADEAVGERMAEVAALIRRVERFHPSAIFGDSLTRASSICASWSTG